MDRSIEFPCAVWRIRLRWDGTRWDVARSNRIEAMTLPRSLDLAAGDAAAPGDDPSFELRDAEGALLYRRHVMGAAPEVFLSSGTIRRDDVPDHPAVDLLVPDAGPEAVVRLVSSELPCPEESVPGEPQVVAELLLSELTAPQDRRRG